MPKLIAYSQNDPRWAALEYAGGTTFASAGCLVCCVAMILSTCCSDPDDPPEVAARLRDAGAFSGNLLSRPARIHDAYPSLVEWGGAVHWRTVPADLEFLARQLDRYRATIIELKWNPRGPSPERGNQHFTVLTGLDTDGEATVMDPWDGVEKLLSTTRYRLAGWSTGRTIYGIRMVQPAL